PVPAKGSARGKFTVRCRTFAPACRLVGGAAEARGRWTPGRAAREPPRAPERRGRPSAEALVVADGVWGRRKRAGRAAPEHWDGPREKREAERGSARCGRRGLGASEARRARSARALGRAPREEGGRARKRSLWPTGSGGVGSAQGAQRPSTGRAPRYI